MSFELPELPYPLDALKPHISKETLEYHWGKHHRAYVNNLNNLLPGSGFEGLSLEEIIKKSSGSIFNNAAQIWNHTFYWHCLSPKGGNKPSGRLAVELDKAFGSFEEFKEKFTKTAVATFGAGWAWLAKDKQGKLEIMSTSNAGLPITEGKHALLTCDVWEHAYYIDYRNARPSYIEHFWSLVDWEFVSNNLSA